MKNQALQPHPVIAHVTYVVNISLPEPVKSKENVTEP